MQEICLIISLAAFLIALMYSIRKMDIFNPIFLYTVPMSIQYWIYFFVYREIRLNDITYIVVLFNFIFYFLGYFIVDITRKNHVSVKKELYYNKTVFGIFTAIAVLGFFLGAIEMYRTGTSGGSDFFTNIRINEVYGSGKSFFTKYSTVLLFVVTMVYLYNYLMNKKNKLKLAVLIVFLVASTFFTMARTELLTYVLSVICLIYTFKKDRIKSILSFIKKYRKLLLLAAGMAAAFALLGRITTRATDTNFMSRDFFLYRYWGYTLVTFDKFYAASPSVNSPVLLFGVLEKILKIFGVYFPYVQVVPIYEPYNVAGYYCTIYATCGLWGIVIVNVLLGIMVSWIYAMARERGGYSLIFYSTYMYAIIMSFFAYQYANTLYLYIILLMIILKTDSKLKYHI